ncbi:MAG: hypothetical protein FJZ00_12230, partial [Candidatus Sericytochromatia bacterium]|nr:hypothetical protein [Candidatus Tanganyikabacteria bacterium]
MTRAFTAAVGRGPEGPQPDERFRTARGRTLGELAAIAASEVVGDPALRVMGVADPASAGPGDMVFLVEPRYRDQVLVCKAGFVLASERLDGRPGLLAKHARVAMARVLAAFAPPGPETGIAPAATVDPTAALGPDISIGPGVSVGARAVIGPGTVLHPNVVIYPDVRIGRNCVIHAGVVVREGCVLGDRVVVQPGAVIGSDGFGFVPTAEGIVKIPQLGAVLIEDDVEV